jgi:DNA-binding transcriptional LysR family regulator
MPRESRKTERGTANARRFASDPSGSARKRRAPRTSLQFTNSSKIDKLSFMIQLGRLEGFFRVARAQGYARAARQFPYPITQPGVHQQVRNLEKELGVVLFERVGKDRVVLTPAGKVLYDHVAPFMEGLPDVELAIRGGTHGGTLRLAAAGLMLRQLLPPWLRRLQARRPDIDLALSETRGDGVSRLRSGDVDVLVDVLPSAAPDLHAVPVATVRAFIAVPARHPAARRKRLRIADLRPETFIAYGPARPQQRALQMRVLEAHRVSPSRVHTADSSENILGFVAAGLGYSVVPSLLGGGPRFAGVVSFPLDPPTGDLPVVAAWRKGPRNQIVQYFLDVGPRLRPVDRAGSER